MKTLFLLLAVFVIACAGPVDTSDPWQGMTPAEYADAFWDKPDKEIPEGLTRSQQKVLMNLLEVGSIATGGALSR